LSKKKIKHSKLLLDGFNISVPLIR